MLRDLLCPVQRIPKCRFRIGLADVAASDRLQTQRFSLGRVIVIFEWYRCTVVEDLVGGGWLTLVGIPDTGRIGLLVEYLFDRFMV